MNTPSPDFPSLPTRAGAQRRHWLPRVFFAMALVSLGALVALLCVNLYLQDHVRIYGQTHMAEVSAMLDLLDGLLAYDVIAGALLLGSLLLSTISWAWLSQDGATLRWAVTAVSACVVVLVATWLLTRGGTPAVPPMTPTPAAAADKLAP